MPTILKIGYQTFLMKRAADAAAVVKAMADAMQVRESYRDREHYYWPESSSGRSEISMMTVLPWQLLAQEPAEDGATDIGGEATPEQGYAGAHNANGRRVLRKMNGRRQLLLGEG